jgi:hypothetical protein
MYKDLKQRFNHGEVNTLKGYDYSAHQVKDPSKMTGPDRLISYHDKSKPKVNQSPEFDIEKELEDIFEFKQTKTEIAPPKPKKLTLKEVKPAFDLSGMMKAESSVNDSKNNSHFEPLKKKSLIQHESSLNSNDFPRENSLYLGSLQGILNYMKKPNPLPTIGDSFRGIRSKPQESTVAGRFKVKTKDYRRFLIEVKGHDELIMGHLDEATNKLLSRVMDAGIIEVWISLVDMPSFTSPSNQSLVSVEVCLLPACLGSAITVPLSRAEEQAQNRFEDVKDNLTDLIRHLRGPALQISKDVATKPLAEWKFTCAQSLGMPLRDPASMELLDGDCRVQMFIDSDLNDAGVMGCDKDPELFSKELHLMEHQRFALSWLKMREGVLGYNPNLDKMFESDIHPMWCELEMSLDHILNQPFKDELCRLVEFREKPTNVKIYYNPYSGQLSRFIPAYGEEMKNFKGGILADEMGLGKTVMMIALMLSNRLISQEILVTDGCDTLNLDQIRQEDFAVLVRSEPYTKQSVSSKKQRVFMSPAHFKHCVFNKLEPGVLMDTLIVVPTSLVYQWRDEIKKFSAVPIKVLVYSEDEKVDMFDDIKSFDIVIVSYNKLSYDFKTLKSRIHSAYWYRIVLDECHYIRNRRTQLSKAVCALKGERRWCLSGTPIQNSMDDLFSLVAFMNYAPWSDYHWWNQNINLSLVDPQRKAKALNLMSKILKPVMLRRTKAQHQHLLGLKNKNICIENITLSLEEKGRYDSYYLKSKKTFQDLIRQGNLSNCYMAIWPMLMKLRQLCDHFLLAKSQPKALPAESIINSLLQQIEKRLEERSLIKAELTEEEEEVIKKKGREISTNHVKFDKVKYRKWIENFYYSADDAPNQASNSTPAMKEDLVLTSCPICLTDDLENPIITTCGHFGCLPCMQNWLSNNRTCPFCSFILRREDLFNIPIE